MTTTINKTFLIILLGILAATGPFTIDMYIPGFSEIAKDFGTDQNRVAFTMTSYFIGIALGQLIYGPLVDKYGRKKPLLIGLSIYILAAVGCALSLSIEMMIALRFFQALGASAGMVAATAVITDVYKPDERAKAFSLIMLVMGIAPIVAPSFGSFFMSHFKWQAIFYFLAGFGIFVTSLIFFFLPETGQYMNNDKLAFKKVTADYLNVFKDTTFFLYTLAGSLANALIFAYIASASFIFLTFYDVGHTTFSILFAINAAGLISGNYLNGQLSGKINYIRILHTSSVVLTVVVLLFAGLIFVNPTIDFKWVVAGIFLIEFGIGFTYPNAIAASLAPFTRRSGTASALNGSIRMGVGALTTAIIGLFVARSSLTMFATMGVLSVLFLLFVRLAKAYADPTREFIDDGLAQNHQKQQRRT